MTNEIKPKSREEIEALKQSWLKDPCWDIAKTEGFEAHIDELDQFHNMTSETWELERKQKEQAKRDVWFTLKLNESHSLDNYTEIMRVPGGWILKETVCSKEPSSRDHDDAEFVMNSTFIPYSKEFNNAAEPATQYLGGMQAVEISPGDTLVIHTDDYLTVDTSQRLTNIFNEKFPNNKCIVMTGGMKLGVINHNWPDEIQGYPAEKMEFKS